MPEKLIKLSRTISHALRHAPEEYGIVLDENGWISIVELIHALVKKSEKWSGLEESDIYAMAQAGEKQRYEFDGAKIRAIYGHSFQQRISHDPVKPPDILYHGTTRGAWSMIQSQGIKPMKRQYVHLSPDTEVATEVAKRRTAKEVMIKVDAKQAYLDGIKFYRGNDNVWLVEYINAQYLCELV